MIRKHDQHIGTVVLVIRHFKKDTQGMILEDIKQLQVCPQFCNDVKIYRDVKIIA